MGDALSTLSKRDRRGGWNRNAPTRHDGATQPAVPALEPIAFINRLTHTKGAFAGQTFHLRPWQLRILKRLFKKRPDGLRQYRTCLLMLPRKNGKTAMAAAVALYGLLADGEVGAEVYSAATDRDQAGLVFGIAAQMVRNDPELDGACYIAESQKRIVHRASGSVYRAISAEATSKHGFDSSLVVYDELHAAGTDRRLFDVLSTSMGARRQPLLLIISTAGYDRHSILWELYQHAQKVVENPALDPTFLPILYEAPPDADWTSEQVWRQANPALGDFRSLEDMQIACKRAQDIPAQENNFRRLFLNQWTEQSSRWLSLAAWDACQQPIDRAALKGRRCYLGLDLSSTSDLTALVAVFPDDAGGFDVLARCFVPAEKIRERAQRDHVPYDQWAREERLTVIPGASQGDYAIVRQTVNAWRSEFDVQMVGVDPWNAITLIGQLKQDQCPVVEVRQTFAGLSASTKALEAAVLGTALRHADDPVLRWQISNVSVDSDPHGNLKPSKTASTEKIDAVVALIMAIDGMDRNAQTPTPNYDIMVIG